MHFSITREPSSTSKPEVDPPVVLKLEGPRSLFSVPGLIFLHHQAYLPSVLGLPSLVPGLSSLSFRPIFPQSQAYLLAVSGLSSRFNSPVPAYLSPVPVLSSPSPNPIFSQFRAYPPSVPGLYSPGPRPIFPQSQVYRPSVPGPSFLSSRPISPQSRSSFASQLSPNLPATEDDGRCDLLLQT